MNEVIICKPEKLKPETLAALVRAAEVAQKQFPNGRNTK